MANRKPTASTTNTALINKLLENPQFPVYVQTLEPQILNKLVQRVGKEDAQALLTWATDEQIQDLIETDTWRSRKPGEEEQFDPEQFLEWLELWTDMGPDFLTAKLRALGSELFAYTLQRYVVVVDLEEVGVSGDVDTFRNFGVMPKSEDNWPLLLRLLIEVWDEDEDFLEECLARCCQRRSLVVEKTYITDNESLQFDVAGNRDRHRRKRGYVTSVSAAAFLAQARDTAMEKLLIEVAYDPFTSVHLRQIARRAAATVHTPTMPANSQTTSVEQMEASVTGQDWQELETLVSALSASDETPAARLLLGSDSGSELYLKQQLRAIGMQSPEALVARQNEIIYIANILMEGASMQGRCLNEQEAGLCANAAANLGLMYCVFEEAWDEESAILHALLQETPGLIKAFRIGYHLLCQLPLQIMAALQRELASPKARRRLRRDPWIEQQVNDTLRAMHQATVTGVEALDKVNALLEPLSLIADNTILQQLCILNDVLPRFPESLEADAVKGVHVNRKSRFIETPADLQQIHTFLLGLQGKLL